MREIKNIELENLSYKATRMNKRDIGRLATNIETYGLQFPLIVVDGEGKDKGRYEIIDGRRRFEAFKVLTKGTDLETVSCIVITKDETNEDLSLVLNTYRLNFNPVELYNMAAKYVKDELKGDPLSLPPERIKDVAAKLNLDIHATCRILNIGRLSKEVQDLLSSKKIPLGLALLTLRIPSKGGRKEFLKRCIEERPSISEAVGWLRYDIQSAPNRNLNNASFDVHEECVECRYRGYQDKSLFDDISNESEEEEKDYCWNPSCYGKKEKNAWQEAFKEAREKLGLTGISKQEGWMNGVMFKKVKAVDPEQCKKCKQVKLTKYPAHGDGILVICPISCANIKQRKKADAQKEKMTKKDPKKFTKKDKELVLEERFGVAARKVMIENFFVEGSRKFEGGKQPKSYKRILFFVGYDARANPFLFETYDIGKSYDPEKEQKKAKKIIADLDLKKVAKYNVETAANHLYSYDVAHTTPEEIDGAIALLYGIEHWCKLHYDEIKEKLSKRSKQFLEDLQPWKPSWA